MSPILIAVAWLNVVTIIIAACRVAARADAIELEVIHRTAVEIGTPVDVSCDRGLGNGSFHCGHDARSVGAGDQQARHVSGFLFEQGANIVSHQYSSDPSGGRFFLRTEFFLPESPDAQVGEGPAVHVGAAARERLQTEFDRHVATRFEMDWKVRWWGERVRIAILLSRDDHCLFDLLWRWRRGELDAEIVAVVSNHS